MTGDKKARSWKDTASIIISITILIGVTAGVSMWLSATTVKDGVDYRACPRIIEGNPNATLVIKYFDSPYCMYCIKEEPSLQALHKEIGDLYRFERYDIRYCKTQVKEYRVMGTPTHVFNNTLRAFTIPGYMEKWQLEDTIRVLAEEVS